MGNTFEVMEWNTSLVFFILLVQLFMLVSSSETTESSSTLPPPDTQAGRCSRNLHQTFDPLMHNLITNIKLELASFQEPQVMVTDQHELATLVAEKLYQKVKEDLISSGTGIISQKLTELTGMKDKLEERLNVIEETNSERFTSLEETIEENKVSNNNQLESLVETTASNSERLDSLKETIEETDVSNIRERLDTIEETLQKDKPNQVYFSAYADEGGEVVGHLKFPKIVINLGDAFDGSSGTFTAPVKGVYTFSFSGQQSADATTATGDTVIELRVQKNGVLVFIITDDRNNDGEKQKQQNINSIFSLELNENDTVNLYSNSDDKLYASGGFRLIFMGHLVVAT